MKREGRGRAISLRALLGIFFSRERELWFVMRRLCYILSSGIGSPWQWDLAQCLNDFQGWLVYLKQLICNAPTISEPFPARGCQSADWLEIVCWCMYLLNVQPMIGIIRGMYSLGHTMIYKRSVLLRQWKVLTQDYNANTIGKSIRSHRSDAGVPYLWLMIPGMLIRSIEALT